MAGELKAFSMGVTNFQLYRLISYLKGIIHIKLTITLNIYMRN